MDEVFFSLSWPFHKTFRNDQDRSGKLSGTANDRKNKKITEVNSCNFLGYVDCFAPNLTTNAKS
jgi:hypothetical protein